MRTLQAQPRRRVLENGIRLRRKPTLRLKEFGLRQRLPFGRLGLGGAPGGRLQTRLAIFTALTLLSDKNKIHHTLNYTNNCDNCDLEVNNL